MSIFLSNIVLCMGNAVGAAKITELMAGGITLGLGTDGYVCDMITLVCLCIGMIVNMLALVKQNLG